MINVLNIVERHYTGREQNEGSYKERYDNYYLSFLEHSSDRESVSSSSNIMAFARCGNTKVVN